MERKLFDELTLSLRDLNKEEILEKLSNCQNDEELRRYLLKEMFNLFLSSMVNSTEIINFRYDEQKHGKSVCLICKKALKTADLCRKPDCSHIFHSICILSHLNQLPKEEHKCPLCSAPLHDKLASIEEATSRLEK